MTVVDWLLDSDPSGRLQVMRDLMEKTASVTWTMLRAPRGRASLPLYRTSRRTAAR